LGDLALREADLAGARRRYEAALALYPQLGDRLGEANVQKALGDLALREDDLAGARRRYEAALALYPQLGDRLGEANVHGAEARSWAERAIALHTANQSRFDVALDCETLAMACKDAGDFEGGIAALRKAAQHLHRYWVGRASQSCAHSLGKLA
jgi:tetratricopeptide (TPR) repeat protein